MAERDEDADRAEDAADRAEDARDSAEEAREDAEEAREDAEDSREADSEGSARPSWLESQARPEDLLIHPDDQTKRDNPNPFGTPGPPVSKHSPFYVGFFGALGVMAALVIGLAFQRMESVLVLVLVSMFLAVGLNPIVETLIHRGVRRSFSVAIVSLGVLTLLTLFVVALVPVVRDQITTLIDNGPGYLDQLRHNNTVEDLDRKYDVIDKAKEKLEDPQLTNQVFGSVFTVGLAVLSALFNAFLIFVLTLYFLSALPSIKRSVYSLFPRSRRERVTSLGDEILRRVGGYVAGAFVIALCAGLSSFIFLEFVGLGEYAVALALVVAILDFIPLIGATIGATIVCAIGLATSLGVGIACIIFYIVYQQVENYVIYPRVMRSSVNVPGVVTVIAVLIGGTLLGVVGALLAIPTAAAVLMLTREVFVRRQDQR